MIGTNYDYRIYKNVLRFLAAQDVFVDHLRPEFLLTYERYLIFKDTIKDEDYLTLDDILQEDSFNILSKLQWTELILRIYKTLAFDRILSPPFPKGSNETFQEIFLQYLESKMSSKPENCNGNEFKLMKWVEFHSNKQVKKMGMQKKEINGLRGKNVDTLDIIAVILTYCPYTENHFRDVYTLPNNISQYIHNFTLLENTMNTLKLSYRFQRFVENKEVIENVILLTYLYSILPSFYPSDTITIEANIGDKSCHKIGILNTCGSVVSYYAKFFENKLEQFVIDFKTIVLPPKQKKDLVITYTAKDFNQSTAILVLSGERQGTKYTKSKIYSLVGKPDITYFTDEFTFKVIMYNRTTNVLNLKSPCGFNYKASTHLSCMAKESVECLPYPIPISDIQKLHLPKEYVFPDTCIFCERGTADMEFQTCLVSHGKHVFFLYFRNNDVGIFCVKITVYSTLSEKIAETIEVPLPVNFQLIDQCICKTSLDNSSCPRIFYVSIPCRNRALMKGLKEMFRMFAEEKEYRFWSTNLGKCYIYCYVDRVY